MKIEKIRGLLGLARRARGLTIGSRETRTSLRRGEVRLVILAEDGSARDAERLIRVTAEENIPAYRAGTSAELGDVVGMAAVSVVGVRDRNLANGIRELIDEETRSAQGPNSPGGE